MRIKYYVKNVYGIDRMYIEDLDIADIIYALTKCNSLTPENKFLLERLGFTLTQTLPPGRTN